MIGEAFKFMRDSPLPGCFCEFGVWTGDGLEQIEFIARSLGSKETVYGFDSFEGMPPTEIDLKDNHGTVWAPGSYAVTLESVQKRFADKPTVRLIKSVFADLKPLSEYGIDKVRFARIDCDIYEGYRDALRLLTPHIQIGTLLLFDEAVAVPDFRYYESLRDSGSRAVFEWQKETGFRLNILKSVWTECLTKVEERV